MMGGILVATVLTILVLPAGYALFFGKEKKKPAEPQDKSSENIVEIAQRPALAAE
jgi:hypothetical protein